MAVIEHSITFGGVNSADFGIFIYGDGSFDAPKRAVEMVSIPGRNGELAMDKGYFENIEVTYPAFYDGDNWTDFAQQIADFRNALCSQFGYQRLEDTFNTGEYRMGTYKDGLEVDVVKYNSAGHFDITFNCMPQRFLTDGENPIEVSSGDIVTNPTLFESKPLLEVLGYGTINIGGQSIEIGDVPIGDIEVTASLSASAQDTTTTVEKRARIQKTTYLNSGDIITLPRVNGHFTYTKVNASYTLNECEFMSVTDISPAVASARSERNGVEKFITFEGVELEYGTAKTVTGIANFVTEYTQNGTVHHDTEKIALSVVYEGDDYITLRAEIRERAACFKANTQKGVGCYPIHADSTKSATGIRYIDLDIGEAYMLNGGSAVSLNNVIQLPANLPALGAGDTTITFDNTITALSIVPRWYKL